MSDFIHDPTTKVSVINGPEGSTVIEQETTDFAHPPDDNTPVVNPEDIEVPEPVPYRASTPESDKANVETLFKEGKISEDEMKARHKEIDEIAKDPTVSPQEPEPEPEPKAKVTEKEEAHTTKDSKK